MTVSQVEAGHTEATIAVAVLDPPAARYCCKIIAYAGKVGVSDVRCNT